MTYTFQLSYDKRYAGPAVVALRNAAQDDSGEIAVSHECFGIHEFEVEIQRLKAELDDVLSKARRDFAFQPKSLFVERTERRIEPL
ncbi:MAG: hypothetical protein Q8K82_25950 [Gemmatimonadaceae bacterium]|nr:hypothetical protein [Gemmatimonadaceae bacterium]